MLPFLLAVNKTYNITYIYAQLKDLLALSFYIYMKNRIVFDQLVAIIIVKMVLPQFMYTHTLRDGIKRRYP